MVKENTPIHKAVIAEIQNNQADAVNNNCK
jgi:hypothetical protein